MEKCLKEAKGSWWQRVYITEGRSDVQNIIKHEATRDSLLQLCDCNMSRLVSQAMGAKAERLELLRGAIILSEYNACSLPAIRL